MWSFVGVLEVMCILSLYLRQKVRRHHFQEVTWAFQAFPGSGTGSVLRLDWRSLRFPCFHWEAVPLKRPGHLCQRAILGESGFGVQDMCFWYLFGRPSWWSLGIVQKDSRFSTGNLANERQIMKHHTVFKHQIMGSNGRRFCFPGSSSRLIRLPIVR